MHFVTKVNAFAALFNAFLTSRFPSLSLRVASPI